MSVIIDLNLVCLVCLQESDELRCVFENDDQTQQPIAEKIARCSELCPKIENSKLPDNICRRCLSDLDVAWRFRINCETANSVFLSIQQQEQEAEALANFELEQQKIKLPSGLKIKRIQPETKTYLLPVLKDDETETTDAQEQEENEEDGGSPESETETEKLEEVTEEEHVDFDEYYETDYMLDSDEEVVSVLKEDNVTEDNTIKMDEIENFMDHAEEAQHIEIKIEEDDEDADTDGEEYVIEKPQPKQPEKVRTGLRGRPRKNTQISVTEQSAIKEEEVYHLKIAKKSATIKKEQGPFKKPAPMSDRSTLHSKNGFVPVATRKRKSLSPDSRPAKICEICGNSYKYQHALNAHMRRHTNTRPFSCEFCDKAFVSGVELRRHMRVHTGHKPYPCQHCDRRFSDFGSRIKHERTHTGERPYVCGTCGKSFAYAHVLSVHLRTHTGEKRFQCQRCGKGFTKKAYLQSHMKLHADGALYDDEADDMLHDLSGGDMTPIKTVALEECIFTSEYVVAHKDELEELVSDDEEVEEKMAEEHLEEVENSEFILGVR